jgi:uncharacterized oligopeptide transporter (OPT) family protein
VYQVPGDLFQVPTGYVWISTARLVTGQGLPYMAKEWAVAFAVLFALTTMLRIYVAGSRWHAYIPGGIAVAVGESAAYKMLYPSTISTPCPCAMRIKAHMILL